MPAGSDLRVYLPDGLGRCEDCDLRDALTLHGTARLNKNSGDAMTKGCEACGGGGKQPLVVIVPRAIAEAMLTEKQLFVMERRLGSLDGKRYTLDTIARIMGISRQAAHKLSRKGMKKLHQYVYGKPVRFDDEGG